MPTKVRLVKAKGLLFMADRFAMAKRSPEEDEEARVFEELILGEKQREKQNQRKKI